MVAAMTFAANANVTYQVIPLSLLGLPGVPSLLQPFEAYLNKRASVYILLFQFLQNSFFS